MIGTVLRFKLKKTLIGIAALSLLVPMASHADVTKGRWIFDGFSRATRDGQGSTCVGSGGDTHAFAVEDCNGAASAAEVERKKVLEAKAAAKAAADAKKAAIRTEAVQALPGGQQTGSVRRADGIRILDGFGRDCIRDGSIVAATGNCDAVAPLAAPATAAAAAKPAAAAAPAPAPIVPGSALQPDQLGAYVQENGKAPIRDGFGRACIRDGLWNPATASEGCSPAVYEAYKAGPAAPAPKVAAPAPAPVAPGSLVNGESAAYVHETSGSAIRDGFGRSCIKDGRWQTGLATEDCDPDLYNQWRAKTAAEQPAPAVQAAAPAPAAAQPATVTPDANGPAQPDPGPGVAPAAEKAAATSGPVIDNTLPVFPVTTYSFTPDVAPTEPLPAVAELAAAEDDDEADDTVAQADEAEEEEVAALADSEPAAVAEEDETMLAADEDAPAAPTDGSPLQEDAAVMPFIADARSDDDEDEVDDTVAGEEGVDDETAYLGDGPLPEEIPEGVATPVEDETDDAVADGDAWDDEATYLGDGPLPEEIPEAVATPVDDEAEDAVADADAWDDEATYLGDGPLPDEIPDGVATPVEDEIDETPSTDVAAWDDESAYLGDGDLPAPAPVVAAAAAPAAPAAPAAAAAAPVANAECPPTTIEVEQDGRFAFDRYVLRADVIAKLDSIADLLKTAKCEGIHIAGHTDRIGSLKYNQTLSERRATAARNYLVNKKGVDASLITTSGHGETQPVTKPEQCAGKRHKALIKCYAPDRRVFITATLRKPAN